MSHTHTHTHGGQGERDEQMTDDRNGDQPVTSQYRILLTIVYCVLYTAMSKRMFYSNFHDVSTQQIMDCSDVIRAFHDVIAEILTSSARFVTREGSVERERDL